jgi:predicted metal-dependent hydrolase
MTTSQQRCVRFGTTVISFQLTASNRRDLAITVHPDLQVTVKAPIGKSPQQIEAKVLAKAPWILKQQLRFRDLHPLPIAKRYVAGETHRYLGRQYRLRVIQSDQSRVCLNRPFLDVETQQPNSSLAIKKLVDDWVLGRARVVLQRSFESCLEAHPTLQAPYTRLLIRRMSRRWGSCSRSGTITLNPLLVLAPATCIEYVIVHELCHRKVMNHGPNFERLLSRVLPNWRVRRERLNLIGH